jgi:hypothetical protein
LAPAALAASRIAETAAVAIGQTFTRTSSRELLVTLAHPEATAKPSALDARRDSIPPADIAATQARDRIAEAATLVDGVRRLLAEHGSSESNPINPSRIP